MQAKARAELERQWRETRAASPERTEPLHGFETVTTARGAEHLLWVCELCTVHNRGVALMCECCGSARPSIVTAVPPGHNPLEDPFVPNPAVFGLPTVSVRELWTCLACTYSNDPDRGICEMCHGPRGSRVPAPQPNAPQPAVPQTSKPPALSPKAATQPSAPPLKSKQPLQQQPPSQPPPQPKKLSTPATAPAPPPAPRTSAAPSASVVSATAVPSQTETVDEDDDGNQGFTVEELKERRVAPEDGKFYTRQEFYEFYGGVVEWRAAKNATLCDHHKRGRCFKGAECTFRHGEKPAAAQKKKTPPPVVSTPTVVTPVAEIPVRSQPVEASFSSSASTVLPPPAAPTSGFVGGWTSPTQDLGGGWGDSWAPPQGSFAPPAVPAAPNAVSPSARKVDPFGGASHAAGPPGLRAAPAPTYVAAAPGPKSSLPAVLAYLRCSEDTAEKLAAEEFDTDVLLSSSYADFVEIGISLKDSQQIASWVTSTNLFSE